MMIKIKQVKSSLNEKSAQRDANTARWLAKNFGPAADPLPGGTGRPKFNQLEMVTTFTYKTQFGEDRCKQFRVIMVTDPQTLTPTQQHTRTHKQTHRQDRLQHTTPLSLARG